MITGLYSVRASHFRSLCFEAHDVLVVSSVIHRYPQAVPGRSGRSLRSRDWLRTPPSQPARQTLSVPCGRCRHYRLVVSESPPPDSIRPASSPAGSRCRGSVSGILLPSSSSSRSWLRFFEGCQGIGIGHSPPPMYRFPPPAGALTSKRTVNPGFTTLRHQVDRLRSSESLILSTSFSAS